MKAEIYQWVRILASFYILFTVILQLIPDKKYERYIRSFMGLLLIYILAIPLLDITGNSSRIIESFFVTMQRRFRFWSRRKRRICREYIFEKVLRRKLHHRL